MTDLEFARVGDNNRIELDQDAMRSSRAYDFRDPWNKAVNAAEGKTWVFLTTRQSNVATTSVKGNMIWLKD